MDNTGLRVGTMYDDPVGTWYKCESCKKDLFIPDWDLSSKEADVFNFCPYCGKKIDKINGDNT